MNGKYILVLFVAVQVSMILCVAIPAPEPDAELVANYELMKVLLVTKLGVLDAKVRRIAPPLFQAVKKFVTVLASFMGEDAKKYERIALGLYPEYLKPFLFENLDADITEFLNAYLPAE